MKKVIVSGVLAAALIAGGGTGAYMAYAKENTPSPITFMHQQGTNMGQMMSQLNSDDLNDMQQFMEEGNLNFGQMKPYMKKMHPNLSDQELEDLYKSMHGTGGESNSKNFKGMMGNNL